MPEISFYILQSQSSEGRYLFACKLIEKAYRSGHFSYVLTDAIEQSRILDDLLWTFRPGSFVPHQLYMGELPAIDNVILIGSESAPKNWQKTIINLSTQCPQAFQQTDRILEILDENEEIKASGRNRYRQYQQAGIVPTTHKL